MDQHAQDAAPFLKGYQLPGYERALNTVIVQSCQILTQAQLPEPFQKCKISDQNPIGEQLAGDIPVESLFPIHHEAVTEFDDCMSGKYSVLLDQLALQASDAAMQVATNMLSFMDNFLGAAGQTINATPGGSILDFFLDGLDGTLMQFHEDGRPDFSACYMVRVSDEGIAHTHYAPLVAAIEQEGTPDQQERLRHIIDRQRHERDSQKRHF